MNTSEHRRQARWVRLAALVLLIAVTPFSWLVVRDTILVLRASEGMGAELAHDNLVDRFVQTIRDSKISINSRKPMQLTMVFDPSCFKLEGGKFRLSDTPAAQSSFRDKRQPSLEEILSSHRFLAESRAEEIAESKALADSFSTPELILFNACIAATPFSAACETRVAARRDRAYDKAFAEVSRSFGIKAQRVGKPEQYCYIMPDIVAPPVP
ncbi:hypothetical protein EEB18_014510 [Sphingopyxis sp. OPL5]|uniref:hypothetical protein n=1 Tax=Sphingopyxis sp. OPL5 TaxID=2486273 RepID=UPI00164E3856|nr:hypothetical protein [Sphingopyxis sp. OPL5]QNO25993.1 hypothetical protein EEB18_014510 [Sphingopyxis sp. OPL5]